MLLSRFPILYLLMVLGSNGDLETDPGGHSTTEEIRVSKGIDHLNDSITIIGVGDIMMGTNYPENRLPAQNGSLLMKEVIPILKAADVTFGNLEGLLLDEGGTARQCRNPSTCYIFRSPERYVENLKEADFDLISVANNHQGDFGAIGRQRTMQVLAQIV